MARYERSVLVDAPFERVWTFHTAAEGLAAVTPSFLGLEIEAVVGPDGEPDPEAFRVGTRIRMAVRPFGSVPVGGWTVRIAAVERGTDAATFRDEMVEGPFRRWVHTHRVAAVDGRTRVRDHVEYELPLGPARDLSGLARPLFALLFRHRHRRTKAILEG